MAGTPSGSPQRRWIVWPIAAIAGAAAGLLSALWLAGLLPGATRMTNGNVSIDGWSADFTIGTEATDPYARARVARFGLLAMARTEAIYFQRSTDDSGNRLDARCSYRLSGGPMPARWWSITLYDAAGYLPHNTDAALSIDATKAGDGPWQAIIAPERPQGAAHWISSRNAASFDLTLRLYVPDQGFVDHAAQMLAAPKIERLACKGTA